jgi:potassium-transporting ATPase KdpC subunit
MLIKQLKSGVIIFCILTVITGIIYPIFITVAGQLFFNKEANGSLIHRNGIIIGSSLIGQPFTDPKYFWSRPSETSPAQFNAASSQGSNLGPSNDALTQKIKERIKVIRSADPSNKHLIPVDMVTSSASGLDPHISKASAYYQAKRIASARRIPESVVKEIISKNTKRRFFHIIGENVVNVLSVNLDLDSCKK